jgi:hypothetical protein
MAAEGVEIEIIYEAPKRTQAWWWALAGLLMFLTSVLWVVVRMIRRTGALITVGIVLALAVVWPFLTGRTGPLRTQRVVADSKKREVLIVHRKGEERVAFDEITDVTPVTVVVAEGVPLDAVCLHLGKERTITLGVLDKGAAEGATRALRAVLNFHVTTE